MTTYNHFYEEVWWWILYRTHPSQQVCQVFRFYLVVVPDGFNDVPHAWSGTTLGESIKHIRPERKQGGITLRQNDSGNEVAVGFRCQLWDSPLYSCFLYIYNSLWFLALFLRELAVFYFITVVKSSPDVPQRFHVKLSDREHETGKFNCGDWFGLVDRQNCDQFFKNGFRILRSALENWFTAFWSNVLVQQVGLSCLCWTKKIKLTKTDFRLFLSNWRTIL